MVVSALKNDVLRDDWHQFNFRFACLQRTLLASIGSTANSIDYMLTISTLNIIRPNHRYLKTLILYSISVNNSFPTRIESKLLFWFNNWNEESAMSSESERSVGFISDTRFGIQFGIQYYRYCSD